MKPLEPGTRYVPRVPASPRLFDREESPAAPSSSLGIDFPTALMLLNRVAQIEDKLDALIAWIQAAEITSVEVKP